jgi:hypothetical protein
LFENGVVGIWSSLTSQARWLGADGGHWAIRVATVLAAMVVALVALGPSRLKALGSLFSSPSSELSAPPAGNAEALGLSDNLTIQLTPEPRSPSQPVIDFQTKGTPARPIEFGFRPSALRFIVPPYPKVTASELPVELPVGQGKLIVKQFTSRGFVVEESRTLGDRVQVEGYRAADDELIEAVQDELVRAADDGSALFRPFFGEPDYGPFTRWRDRTAAFLETILGPRERQRFLEFDGPSPADRAEALKHHLRRLAELRDRPESWPRLRVDEDGLADAVQKRRFRTLGEQIAEADIDQPEPTAAELAATKAHARHVVGELSRSDDTVARALQQGRWWNVQVTGLQFKEWLDGRDLLHAHAPALYDRVDAVYAIADRLNAAANEDNLTFGPAEEFSREGDRADLQRFRDLVPETVAALRGYCEGHPAPGPSRPNKTTVERSQSRSDPSAQHSARSSPSWGGLLKALPFIGALADLSLRRELEEKLQEGRTLLTQSGLILGRTEEDIVGWEAEVKYLLRDDHEKLSLFLRDPERAAAPFTYGPDWRRLRKRLEQLEKVIALC